MQGQRIYQQNLCRATMGLLMGMADVLDITSPDTDKIDHDDVRNFLTGIEYCPEEDLFMLLGTRKDFADLCGWLLKAAEISKLETFRECACILVAVIDEADSYLFSTAPWN